jgi:hypothetical protein
MGASMLHAQAPLLAKISLCPNGNSFAVVIETDSSFNEVPSSLVFTVWAGGVNASFLPPVSLNPILSIEPAGSVYSVSGSSYQKYVMMGIGDLQSLGKSWGPGIMDTIALIYPQDLSLNYLIVNNTWTAENNGDFYAELNGVDKTGTIGFICNTILNPEITLEGEAVDKINTLNWNATSMYQINHFRIERISNNGKYEEIQSIERPSPAFSTEFSYEDLNWLNPTSYYKVIAVDFNGNEYSSNEVSIRNNSISDLKVYPNPFQDQINIFSKDASITNVEVFDYSGRSIFKQQLSSFPQSYKLHLHDLPEGIYFLKVPGFLPKKIMRQ